MVFIVRKKKPYLFTDEIVFVTFMYFQMFNLLSEA